MQKKQKATSCVYDRLRIYDSHCGRCGSTLFISLILYMGSRPFNLPSYFEVRDSIIYFGLVVLVTFLFFLWWGVKIYRLVFIWDGLCFVWIGRGRAFYG